MFALPAPESPGPMARLLWAVSGDASTLPTAPRTPSSALMTEQALEAALTRTERALAKAERASDAIARSGKREEQLRVRVREAIAELDQLIQRAEA